MRVRPVTEADFEELARGLKIVVDEKRWVAIQPPVSEAELADGLRERLARGRPLFTLEDPDGEGVPALVGHIDLHPTRTDGVWAFGMWVLPGARGNGGGRMLLGAASTPGRRTSTRSNSRSGPTARRRSPFTTASASSARACAATSPAAATAASTAP